MAEKKYYIGSHGPYYYDDAELIDDPDGDFSGEYRQAFKTNGEVESASGNFPAGGIIMWSGSIASIPSGWVICDGTNSTPDLRDRFILGAGTTAVGATGVNGLTNVESLELVAANIPSHRHSISDDGAHSNHVGSTSLSGQTGTDLTVMQSVTDESNHDHGGVTGYTGSGTAINVSPPYYALAFIMKTA